MAHALPKIITVGTVTGTRPPPWEAATGVRVATDRLDQLLAVPVMAGGGAAGRSVLLLLVKRPQADRLVVQHLLDHAGWQESLGQLREVVRDGHPDHAPLEVVS